MAQEVEILLADDSPAVVELTVRELRRHKLANHIHVAEDGQEALDFIFCRGPFKDRSFDLVVCVAVLMHLEGTATVEAVVSEVGRVCSGKAVVVTPCGEDAHESDLRMLEWLRRQGLTPRPWFADQVRRPVIDPLTITRALGAYGDVTVGTTVSVPWNERFFRAEQRLRRIPGAMTSLQPLLRLWGSVAARELGADSPPYERFFVLDVPGAGARAQASSQAAASRAE